MGCAVKSTGFGGGTLRNLPVLNSSDHTNEHQAYLSFIIAAAALCAGCEGNGPNTQNGAVAGGALGALAGRHHRQQQRGPQRPGRRAIGGVVGAIAGGTIGNSVDHQNGTIYHSEYEATTNVAVPDGAAPPPPPPAELQTAQPTPSAIWIYGYYDFDGNGYLWVPGHWEIPPPNCGAVRPPALALPGRYLRLHPRLLALGAGPGLEFRDRGRLAAVVGADEAVPGGRGFGVDHLPRRVGVVPADRAALCRRCSEVVAA
jgi:hypothetical protein